MKRPNPTRIGEKVLAIRRNLGLSQAQLARRINSDMDHARVSDYELGKRIPTILTLLKYARMGQVSLESLVDDEMDLNPR